jgi:hypothetical protein
VRTKTIEEVFRQIIIGGQVMSKVDEIDFTVSMTWDRVKYPDFNDMIYNMRLRLVAETKQALKELILSEVIGQDQELLPKDGGMVEDENTARSYQNLLRTKQREAIEKLFKESDQ